MSTTEPDASAPVEPTIRFASALRLAQRSPATPAVDPALAATETPFEWTEADGSEHTGTQYTFPPETGLPPLRTEWTPRTDGASWGLGTLFLATVSNSPTDFGFDGADGHPDQEQHRRDTLFEPWNLLFPDRSQVWVANGVVVDDFTNDADVVTVEDAIREACRRYYNELRSIHPDPRAQAVDAINANAEALKAAAQEHLDLVTEAQTIVPDIVVPVESMATITQLATEPAAVVELPVEPDPADGR